MFAAYDRNKKATPIDPTNPDDSLSPTSSQLFSSERMLRRISKAVGFNQVLVSAVSSIDLAEICLYDPSSQPGVRQIYALYPCKAFRVYVSQFMAGENMVEYQPAISIPESNIMKIRMDGTTPRVSSRATSSRAPASSRGNRDTRSSSYSGINSYSYGVRIRNMEEELVIDVAKMESEKAFRGSFGDEELKHQQSVMDAYAAVGQSDTTAANTISKLMLSTMGPGSSPGNTERLVSGVSKYQKSVEESIRQHDNIES